MGMTKLLMEEREHLEAYVTFDCPICEHFNHHFVEVPPMNLMAEKTSEVFGHDEEEVTCDGCGKSFDIQISNYGVGCDAYLVHYQDQTVDVELPDTFFRSDDEMSYEDYLAAFPQDPATIYFNNAHEISQLANQMANQTPHSLENRMLFVQFWSAFEAYLASRVIAHLDANESDLLFFVEKYSPLQTLKLKLERAISDPNYVRTTTYSFIRQQLFHKFDSIGVEPGKSKGTLEIFRLAMKISLAPDLETLDELRKFAMARHDCVHRNGWSVDGEQKIQITNQFNAHVFQILGNVVRHIEDQLEKRR